MSADEMPCGCMGHADNAEFCKYPQLEETLATVNRMNVELHAQLAQARREALEEAAKQADATEASVENMRSQGKGEWPKPGYVTDDIWSSWGGQAMAARDIARRIRSLAETPKEAAEGDCGHAFKSFAHDCARPAPKEEES